MVNHQIKTDENEFSSNQKVNNYHWLIARVGKKADGKKSFVNQLALFEMNFSLRNGSSLADYVHSKITSVLQPPIIWSSKFRNFSLSRKIA